MEPGRVGSAAEQGHDFHSAAGLAGDLGCPLADAAGRRKAVGQAVPLP